MKIYKLNCKNGKELFFLPSGFFAFRLLDSWLIFVFKLRLASHCRVILYILCKEKTVQFSPLFCYHCLLFPSLQTPTWVLGKLSVPEALLTYLLDSAKCTIVSGLLCALLWEEHQLGNYEL